ncbi:hypothetical protein [Desulfobacca acetoxidans]|uniref:Uncharacterized protein n=1 Tax=Desulfobacca acetoxidans (strain ATCC 700848 / DSM 11109 / ASRB2) TaxID=880072 RepID=F2NC13_DESAR|nr:hypothetical protein Desac_0197 [Desulfobacca acetoxidans DSM 11109]
MEEFKEVIILEEGRLNTTVAKIAKTLAQEGEDRQKNRRKIQGLKQNCQQPPRFCFHISL